MPHPTDESDASTLPDPELNPLLNPLLAAHMGRWAEVYFTSPPEKREQAVAELIRELENTSPQDHAPVEGIKDAREKDGDELAEVREAAHATELVRSCSRCGYRNSEEQKFCGMCGVLLEVVPKADVLQVTEAVPVESRWSEPEPPFDRDSGRITIEPAFSSPAPADRNHEVEDSTWPPPERDFPSFGIEPEPAPYRYRLYVGAVLAILLVALVYMAWRGTKAISSTSGPQATPSKVIPPAPAASAQQPRTTPSDASGSNAPAPAAPSKRQAETNRRKNETADAQPASQIVTKAASSSPVAPEQSGAEELATAEKYLSAAPGVPRDSREAALWLWKAVGKGNGAATMALSDLYLRGDGVAKSCDQARLLLDAAARKGARAAGARLRNLQAFGCE